MNDMQLNSVHDGGISNEPALDESASRFSVIDLLVTLGEGKRLVFAATVVVAALSISVNLLLPPVYTSRTVLMPPQQQKTGLSSLAGLGALSDLGGLAGLKTPDEMYVGLLKSDSVANDLIKRFDLKKRYHEKLLPEAREKLARKVKISGDKKSGFITVEASDKSSEFAAQLANAYADELRTLLDRLAVTDAQQRRVFFQQQIAKTLTRLSDAEATFELARQKSGVVSLDGQVSSTIRASAELRAHIAASEVQLQAMRTYATAENPDVQSALASIKTMREQLAEMERGSAGQTSPDANEDTAALANIRAYREVKYQEALLDEFRKQFELAQVDEAREGPMIQQVDVALPPEKKSGMSLAIFAALSVLSGFMVGVFLTLGRAAWVGRPQCAETVRRLREAWRIRKL